jgi:hypothetical protein
VSDQVSHPNKTTGKIIVLSLLLAEHKSVVALQLKFKREFAKDSQAMFSSV